MAGLFGEDSLANDTVESLADAAAGRTTIFSEAGYRVGYIIDKTNPIIYFTGSYASTVKGGDRVYYRDFWGKPVFLRVAVGANSGANTTNPVASVPVTTPAPSLPVTVIPNALTPTQAQTIQTISNPSGGSTYATYFKTALPFIGLAAGVALLYFLAARGK